VSALPRDLLVSFRRKASMKRTLALLALSALPIAASAQMAAPAPMGPKASATSSNGRTTGITVSASETAQLPATSARIQLNIAGATPATKIDAAMVQPIVDALASAGAEAQLPPGLLAGGYANNVDLLATVQKPTMDMMKSGVL